MAPIFQQLPWAGGLNTSLDESMIPANQLTVCSSVQFDTRGSRKKRDGIKNNFDSVAITGVSVANPTVITATAHGLTTGDTVVISDTSVTPTINGSRVVTVTGANTFTVPINVTATTTVTGSLYSNNSRSVLALHDFWYGNGLSRTQKLVGIMSDGKVFSYSSSGVRTNIVDGGTAYSGTLTSASFLTFGNILLIAVSGSGNVMKYWDGSSSIADVPGTPPTASILREHLGRVVCNDKANPDRLHYSPTGDYTVWNGSGDSGALPIGEGDGDPIGINGIFPTFKGALFVAKKTKLYRVDGQTPENISITKVSNGIGVISNNSIVPIDQDDVFFVSERGIHSLEATQTYGDFSSSYVSVDIQKTFNDSFSKSRLANVWAGYLSNINCVAFTFSLSGSTANDQLYFYHIPTKAWGLYASQSCQSMVVRDDTDKRRLYIGTSTGRISKTLNGTNYDISSAGTNTAISFQVTTGRLYPDNNPYSLKAFKRFILFYKPQNTHNITINVQIDNDTVSSDNSLNFSESQGLDLLGSTFILGSSNLGYSLPLGAYVRHITGIGHSCKLDITTSGTDQAVEIQGFAIEYEMAGESYIAFTA